MTCADETCRFQVRFKISNKYLMILCDYDTKATLAANLR